ncbi:unnamed protein product [Rangifer tarandus platyrhynchus]|uniref:Uncharacterized protein n=1 Tax=Rangifer tarandus platyrhynchus TaxID=3082113 RepID=A0AC59ZFW0_RANTA
MCGSPLAVRQAVGSASRSRSEPLASHRARSSQTVGVPRIASGAFRVTEPPGKREDHVQTLRLAARALTQQRAHGPGAGNSSPRETSSGQGQGQRGTGSLCTRVQAPEFSPRATAVTVLPASLLSAWGARAGHVVSQVPAWLGQASSARPASCPEPCAPAPSRCPRPPAVTGPPCPP